MSEPIDKLEESEVSHRKRHGDDEYLAIKHLPIPVMVLDAGLHILQVNAAVCSLFQYPDPFPVGMEFTQLFAQYPRYKVLEDIERAQEDPYRGFDRLAVRSHHRPVWLRIRYSNLHDKKTSGGRYLVYMQNITEFQNTLEASIEEGQREIGQELHDTVGQYLSGLNLIAHSLLSELKKRDLPLVDRMKDLTDLIVEVDTKVHILSNGLVELDDCKLGVHKALKGLKERIARLFNVHCEVSIPPQSALLPTEYARSIYKIVQEAITNAIKHGRAKRISIALDDAGGQWTLQVEDDGLGFKDGAASIHTRLEAMADKGVGQGTLFDEFAWGGDRLKRSISSGLGIQGMIQRVEELQGRMEMMRTERGTTLLNIRFPHPVGTAQTLNQNLATGSEVVKSGRGNGTLKFNSQAPSQAPSPTRDRKAEVRRTAGQRTSKKTNQKTHTL